MLPENRFKSIIDLVQAFPNELSCHHYLVSLRWGGGYMECPYDGCPGDTPYVFKDGIRYKCKCCKKIYTAKTRTVFEASKLPMIKWFMAIYLFMHKKGISSVQLAKDLSVEQKTAWFMLHRIREVMANEPPKELLDGTIEMDETFIGGKNKNRHQDKKVKYEKNSPKGSWPDKVPIFGMYQRGGTLRAVALSNVNLGTQVARQVLYNIKFKSTIMTDEWPAYNKLSRIYNRLKIDHSRGQYANGNVTTNRIENFWSHLKRGIPSIYIQVSRKHINKYVQEFVFRFNHRTLDTENQVRVALMRSNCRLKLKDLRLTVNDEPAKEDS